MTNRTPDKCNAFPLRLDVEVSEDGRRMTLLAPVLYVDWALGLNIWVPAGFETDFNSVPRFFWRLLGPWEYPEAGVVHDYLYRNRIGRRKDADLIHYRALLYLGCPKWKADLAWAALRSFGGFAWKNNGNKQSPC